MTTKSIFKFISLSSISLVITGCTYKSIEIDQHTDNILTCNKLTTEIANIINENNNINDNTGFSTRSLIQWIGWPPSGVFNQLKASNARDDLDKRLNHLFYLKSKNNCKITYRERLYVRDKGRVSESINKKVLKYYKKYNREYY